MRMTIGAQEREIRQAIGTYFEALNNHEHSPRAASNALYSIVKTLGEPDDYDTYKDSDAVLGPIKKSIVDYYKALDRKEDGRAACDVAIEEISATLGLSIEKYKARKIEKRDPLSKDGTSKGV